MTGLSLIIPTHGRPSETARAVRSALAQPVTDLEVIVVDDASPVPTASALAEVADPRLRIIRLPANRGPAGARNAGIMAANNPWIGFLDSDDWFLPGTLAERLRRAAAAEAARPGRPTAHVCGFLDVMPGDRVTRARIPLGTAAVEDFASGCWFSPGSCLLIRRDTALAIGPQREGLRRLEDLDWFLRFGIAGGCLISQDLVGTAIAIGHNANLAAVEAAAAAIEIIWLKGADAASLSGRARRRLAAYLDLVRGATALAERRWGPGGRAIAASLLRQPRLRRQLCPGWRTVAPPLPAAAQTQPGPASSRE